MRDVCFPDFEPRLFFPVQERRIIWPKEKEKFFTYPCVITCCCKYDHEIGVAFYAFFTAFLCSAAIVYLAVR